MLAVNISISISENRRVAKIISINQSAAAKRKRKAAKSYSASKKKMSRQAQ